MPQSVDPIVHIQSMIDAEPDISQAPPYVRGMDLSGLKFTAVAPGRFEMEWTIGPHLTHYDGIVQGGVVNVIADSGQSFAFWTTATEDETYSTAEFTTRFFRPMKAERVIRVVSEVVNRSRRLGVIESRFEDIESGKLCAIVTGTWMPTKRDFDRHES
ncbi:MAG: PaaI family thioesterase [Pseudomonadota bacterium]